MSGEYLSESGDYSLEISQNGTCKWHQDGRNYYGEYNWNSKWERYYFSFDGRGSTDKEYTGIYLDSGDLLINGVGVHYETFKKVSGQEIYIDKSFIVLISVLIITICVVLIVVFIRTITSRSAITHLTDKRRYKSASKERTIRKLKENKSNPSHITLYSFEGEYKKMICPFCDGENCIEAKICELCNCRLNQ